MLRKLSLVRGAKGLAFALALALPLLGSGSARAGFLVGGNTHPEFPGTQIDGIGNVNGYINFVVYGQGGGAPGASDTYGTGVTGADFYLAQAGFFSPTGASLPAPPGSLPNYLYVFQVLNGATNDTGGGPAPPISSTTVVTAGTIGGFGTLAGPLAGGGGGGPIPGGVGIGGTYLGIPLHGDSPPGLWTFGPPAPAGNQSPASLVAVAPGVNLAIVATNSNTTQLTPTSLQANFAPFGSIPTGGLSYAFGYTTNLPPTSFTTGSIQDHGTSAVGTVPLPAAAPVPEPSTIVMIATALPLGLVYLRRRIRGTITS